MPLFIDLTVQIPVECATLTTSAGFAHLTDFIARLLGVSPLAVAITSSSCTESLVGGRVLRSAATEQAVWIVSVGVTVTDPFGVLAILQTGGLGSFVVLHGQQGVITTVAFGYATRVAPACPNGVVVSFYSTDTCEAPDTYGFAPLLVCAPPVPPGPFVTCFSVSWR